MKRKALAFLFVLVAGTPALAALNAGDPNRDENPRRETASYERLLEGTSRNDAARDEAVSVLRSLSRPMARCRPIRYASSRPGAVAACTCRASPVSARNA